MGRICLISLRALQVHAVECKSFLWGFFSPSFTRERKEPLKGEEYLQNEPSAEVTGALSVMVLRKIFIVSVQTAAFKMHEILIGCQKAERCDQCQCRNVQR